MLRNTVFAPIELRDPRGQTTGRSWASSLTSADLSGVDLTGADLREADLSGANHSRAKQQRADLQTSIPEGANRDGAILYDARLPDRKE